jgi:hypothetical protein
LLSLSTLLNPQSDKILTDWRCLNRKRSTYSASDFIVRWRTFRYSPLKNVNNQIIENLKTSEPNPLVARYKEKTKEIRSLLRPSILSLFFGSVSHLAKGIRKYRVATYFERVEVPPFLFVSSLYLPTYLQSYVGHTYVLNSDEGLMERALMFCYSPILNTNFYKTKL